MSELNPHPPVTQNMRDQYHKLMAIAMHKLGITEVVISADDIRAFVATGQVIALQELTDGLHVRLIDEKAADNLLRQEGGTTLRNDHA